MARALPLALLLAAATVCFVRGEDEDADVSGDDEPAGEDAGGDDEQGEGGDSPPPDYGDYPDMGDYPDGGDMGGGGGGGGGSGGSSPTLKKGVVHADATTFPLIVNGGRPVLVKCDKDYPYGDKEDAYVAFAKREAVLESDLVVVELGVNEYAADDEKDTKELCESMGAKGEDDYPAFRLFKTGVSDVAAAMKYEGEVKGDDLAAWVTKEAGVFLGPPGTLEAFDKLAGKFVRDVAAQDGILAEARKERGLLKSKRDIGYADFYISVMEKVKGAAEEKKCKACEQCFRHTEEKRIKKLNSGSIPADKRKEFERRLNALPAFASGK